MDDRVKNLSPAQRALLEQRLMERRSATARRNQIVRREVESPADLSYAQELLWLLSQVFDDGVAYNAPGAFRLVGALDVEILEQALQALVQRHEILRTTYSVIDSHPMQVIAPEAPPVKVRLVDISDRTTDDQEEEVQRILRDESRFAFDLVNGPVLRSTVIRLGPEDHVFMLVLHHVATDGWSRGVLYRDLTALYEAIRQGAPSPLPPLPIQYADYAVWHRRWLESGVLDQQLDYWKKNLHRAPSRLDLPTDFPRPPIRSYLGDHSSLMVDIPTREGLRSLARSNDATLFVALLAAFGTLLGRYSGQEDVVIGTPFAGRNRTEFEAMVGYFINPLALRLDLSGDPSFSELVKRARTTTLDAFAHADVPYEMVVRATNPERDLSQTPVFQAMMVLHNPDWQAHRPTFEPEGIRAIELTHEKGWSKFDVLLGMSERKDGLNTTWEYSTELFAPRTVQRMKEHFRTLAESAVAHPDRPLSRLSMLSETERGQLLVTWNAKAETLPERETIKDIFEEQVARTPDAEAVVVGDARMTFAELNSAANRIAALLRDADVGPGTLVGIMMEKTPELVPSVLGVVKSGGAYIPLDPLYPKDRIEFMLEDSAPKVLLTTPALLDTIPETDAQVLTVDLEAIAELPDENPPTTARGTDLAYIIYTSGSTGLPKGAMIQQRSLASAHLAYERAYGLRELKAHLQMASFSFDVFTGDMVRSLLAGAKLVLCPLEIVVDPPRLLELMEREGVDAAEFVPATATLLFEHVEREGRTLDFMRVVIVSSEAWRNEKYLYFKRLCGPETRLINAYGLTEATIDSTWFEPPEDAVLLPGRFVPIGQPLLNTDVYILDASLEPAPIGIPGELCIGGIAVARGYLNRPDLTAEKFVRDPFSSEPDALLYRTGDLARWLNDGTIEFIGRTDRQLKIRGFRIEPGEIEAVLERHDEVRAAAVTDREDARGERRLVAYLEPADTSAPPTPTDLRNFIGEHVPAYMIPSAYVFLDTLPYTPNGKVDREALPDPEWDRSAAASAEEFVPPQTETEEQLAAIFAELLGVEQVGRHDSFFELGGHSLLALRLFSVIERKLDVKLELRVLFQGATVAELAAAVEAQRGGGAGTLDDSAWTSLVPLQPNGSKPPLFLTPGLINPELLKYREMLPYLDPDQPVLGLQAAGVDRRSHPDSRVEEMAERYVDEIMRFQPHGPYRLAGLCFGGLVAYEVARRLAERGEEIALLTLIDSSPLVNRTLRGTRSRRELERLKWSVFVSSSFRGKVGWVLRRVKGIWGKVWFKTGRYVFERQVRRGRPLPRYPWNMVLIANVLAMERYAVAPSDAHVTLISIDHGPDDKRLLRWRELAGGGVDMRALSAPGLDHQTMMHEPFAQLVAAELTQALDAAASPRAGRSAARETVPSGDEDALAV